MYICQKGEVMFDFGGNKADGKVREMRRLEISGHNDTADDESLVKFISSTDYILAELLTLVPNSYILEMSRIDITFGAVFDGFILSLVWVISHRPRLSKT
jgi:hypothetical protein